MSATLQKLAELTGSSLIGDSTLTICSVANLNHATPRDLVFCEDEKYLGDAFASPAAAIVVGEFAASAHDAPKPLLISTQPRLAFAKAAKVLRSHKKRSGGIVHPTAVVPPTVVFGAEVVVGAYVVLGEHVHIGDRVCIGAGVCIGSDVKIGTDCEIHSRVTIYHGTHIGNHVIIHAGAVLGSDGFGYVRDKLTGRYHQMPQIGHLIVGDHVDIGANVTIDRGGLEDTVIGAGTKLDNLVHIGHNVRIGENVVIAAQTGISGSCTIGAGSIIGGQVGMGDHATLEEGTILGGQSGILSEKIFREKGPCFGTPAKPLKQYLREQAALSRLSRRSE
ncbi:UDP-3-O-[3-hydroxymyristoyl] glucosamine N-acyltransferase [Candidatus Koribacter versatilis Ellin345]|uniref:UDP-3-O-acylglucosamine N-acyltransferase 2 n=1 Tax=Koribacter versatilis (strain Ellin345) TaxID=204669 RepID=LPXD2_KORVE|nr:UDP-3-O-(3-hydroxymyristoyl)glucosamine N-acyltransferase [Candidatus Koribacter versatilis]Q1IP54.1 RecName: Full=UDP-3-O-acylglucosamine N-acyltransferase 2 [Candidatus Koribacter versatilis Ellin345]ABF41346.1 UDP-3-O-[3-hydroxymyristoyl] glucosamine N-acyltransferase [Candidatus Koribacter versatilis Ellin345]